MRTRRLRKHAADIEVTAFINLIVVLVPFLLSTAVFTRMSVLDVHLPAQSSAAVEKITGPDLKLEVVLRADSIDVGDRIGGLIQRVAMTGGRHDTTGLSQLMQSIKAKSPQTTAATILARPDTPYELLIEVMDAVRERQTVAGARVERSALFPDISIGDAP